MLAWFVSGSAPAAKASLIMTRVFEVANGLTSLLIAGTVLVWLIARPRYFTDLGRFAAGLTGAGCIMAGTALASPAMTPFEGWAAVLLRLGVLLVLIDWFRCLRRQRLFIGKTRGER